MTIINDDPINPLFHPHLKDVFNNDVGQEKNVELKSIQDIFKDDIAKFISLYGIDDGNATISTDPNEPQIPPADKKLIDSFMNAMNEARTITKTIGKAVEKKTLETTNRGDGTDKANSIEGSVTPAQAVNDWMNVSAVVDLFFATNLIAMMITRMNRNESLLKQSIGQVLITMAKETMQLTIQSGEAKAQQFEQEAQKCWSEFAMALGQIVVTTTTAFATASKRAENLKSFGDGPVSAKNQLKASQNAHDETKPFSEIANSTLTAMKSAFEANVNTKKADLERDSALADGVKQLLEKMHQLLTDTFNVLKDDMQEMHQLIEKLFQNLEAALKIATEQWKG